jgi:hypothetical protein
MGARCISAATHRIYESAIAGNVGRDPTNIVSRTGATIYWIDVGPTNKWAALDGEISTQTVSALVQTVVLRPGPLNALFAAGIDADAYSVSVKELAGGTVVFSDDGVLESSQPADYYEYFFDRFRPQTDLLVTDIPPYAQTEVTVSFTKSSGDVKCGVLAVGDLRPLGSTQYGAKAKPKTYSSIKLDEFGTASAEIPIEEANSGLATVTELLDVPAVWVGTDLPEYSGLRVYGLGSGELSYDNPKLALLSINVQGLI